MQAAGPLAIVEAAEITASLDTEKLAIRVVDGFASLRPKLAEWLPLAIELRSRFETLRREQTGATILGCRTWEQFCQEKLGYSDGHVRSLMRGANPATKYSNKARRTATKGVSSPSLGAGDDFTDEEYTEKGVRALNVALRPLESDSSRFARVALRIAAQLQNDFANENDDDPDWGNAGAEE